MVNSGPDDLRDALQNAPIFYELYLARPEQAVSRDISHSRFRSADLQSAFTVVASFKPTASRRSRLSAFRARHEISGLANG
jgi:hypothetical protein